jgi:hypothetical protein
MQMRFILIKPCPINSMFRVSLCTKFSEHTFSTFTSDEEPEELIRYAVLIHNSVRTAIFTSSTEQWETSCLVNDAFGTTLMLFVFHQVVRRRHLLR